MSRTPEGTKEVAGKLPSVGAGYSRHLPVGVWPINERVRRDIGDAYLRWLARQNPGTRWSFTQPS